MSNDNLTPIDMGFAEFVAKLISEVFDAVVTSQAEQEEKLQELHELMALPQEIFIDHLLQQPSFIQQVDDLLAVHFPAESGDHQHLIFEGANYQPKTNSHPESPEIFNKLGVTIEKADFNKTTKQLNDVGVLKIYRKAAEPYAIQKRRVIEKLIEQGLSNIMVESGKISAKLTFNTTFAGSSEEEASNDDGETATESLQPRLSLDPGLFRDSLSRAHLSTLQPIQPINRYVGILKPNINKQVRLTVKQASNKSPQDIEAKSNIFSEVELHFKSIR